MWVWITILYYVGVDCNSEHILANRDTKLSVLIICMHVYRAKNAVDYTAKLYRKELLTTEEKEWWDGFWDTQEKTDWSVTGGMLNEYTHVGSCTLVYGWYMWS